MFLIKHVDSELFTLQHDLFIFVRNFVTILETHLILLAIPLFISFVSVTFDCILCPSEPPCLRLFTLQLVFLLYVCFGGVV